MSSKFFWSQLELLTSHDSEIMATCKTKLCDIAHAYGGTLIESKNFLLTREHRVALAGLPKNETIVICKPNKGSGFVIFDRKDYENKMLHVLNDETISCRLGKLPKYDRTSAIERGLQSLSQFRRCKYARH